MTTVISAIPAAIDALIATFTAAGVQVIDGQGATDDSAKAVVFVGIVDPDSEGLEDAATSDQTWAWLGHVQRDENVSIHCLASAWTGDDNPKVARDNAFAMVRTLSDAITVDPTLGGAVLAVNAIDGLSYRSLRGPDGCRADIPFTVTCRARLS
jgi:hypothetical protein